MKKLSGVLIAVCAFVHPQESTAQDKWPSQPIKLLVTFPAGGNTDAVARLTADFMQKALGGATVVVENHAGAGGRLARPAAGGAGLSGGSGPG